VSKLPRKASNWYCTHKEDKDLTVEDIQEMIEAGDAAGLARECPMLV